MLDENSKKDILFIAPKVPLQLHPHLAAAERGNELRDETAHAVPLGLQCGTPRQRNESIGLAGEILELQIELALRRLQLGARDDAA